MYHNEFINHINVQLKTKNKVPTFVLKLPAFATNVVEKYKLSLPFFLN